MQTLREEKGPPLPLSSMRLFIPPLRLVCAALWQVVERRDIMDYGLLEEFATSVLEIVPELMTYRERVQLLMGLRARLVLELCRCDDELCRPDTVQPHLNRIRSCVSNQKGEVSDPKVEASEASFMKLIETLLEQPEERELFFQFRKHVNDLMHGLYSSAWPHTQFCHIPGFTETGFPKRHAIQLPIQLPDLTLLEKRVLSRTLKASSAVPI
ncbi:uncharacterized protein LOC109875155 isoform X3 [Oncorhynchus kisutch]|uniref:uncharacterized protein LOC109875155 isoform X3 n=1 Tax=Oncorhynchus kisutch TaxID=8019 RepID=UPI0012DDFDBE|nr:uncharacterized protein LOC109875155 isoform X3 [Oncorhynchus kisutch]